ncbi:MAG: ThuA domain-containing protein [Halioglobus sp.]
MRFLNYQAQRRILVTTKGHPFERDSFFAVFDSFEDVETCAVEQPAALALFDPALAADYEAIVFYDMPGMDFSSPDPTDGLAPRYVEPPESFVCNFLQLLEDGKGLVFLHHSIAAWPAWEQYSHIVGGRFLYKPDTVRGTPYPDSGYRHDVGHSVAVTPGHPVTAGLPDEFSITDELYLYHVFDEDVVPLLTSRHAFAQDNFYSAQHAVQGRLHSREGWTHPSGPNVVGWAKHYRNSPIVYLQCGDSAEAYANVHFRQLLHNAINWVSSTDAQEWAAARYSAEH